ncbi:cofilin-2-like [Chiloscyllium plagiosum]|uniref:cofilin-2-like n=1 Tax=Chiloscyllium plagiosum TaxID=36176 RepID=UPI001CB88021|nr:cofilin-2-like [Chiloscyllium plagiosum]
MASGVAVSDEVVSVFQNMKVRKSCTLEETKGRKKAVFLTLNDKKENIVVDKDRQITVGDCLGGDVSDPLETLVKMLPLKDCCYILYDASFETKETKKEEIIFIHWAPDDAPINRKMIFASSKEALRKKLCGVKHEWQVCAIEDFSDRNELAAKLGSGVIALESQRVI